MHVQTCRMRVLSYPDSLYQDDGTVLKNIITMQLPDCWTGYLHLISQSINQSVNRTHRLTVSYIFQFLDEKGLRD